MQQQREYHNRFISKNYIAEARMEVDATIDIFRSKQFAGTREPCKTLKDDGWFSYNK